MKPRKFTVATFSDVEKAHAVRNRLTQAGIPADVLDESKLQRFWFISKPLAAEKVQVGEKDVQRAKEVLKTDEKEGHLLDGQVKCPQCNSPRVEYPQFTRKFMTTTVVEFLLLLHVIDRRFYCQDCHHSWPPNVPLRHTTDRLNWPHKGRQSMVRDEE